VLSAEDQAVFGVLEARLRTMLPPEYLDTYEEVEPVSMGSAGLVYGSDGRVAWDEIWKTFCDLAMAGGPPHRGTLLEPVAPVGSEVGRYRQIVEEICRGVKLVTGLEAAAARAPGWVRVECASAAMAGWLERAIAMENVSCRGEGAVMFLPAGPGYRMEKEIKNVITVMAKTCHYWVGHMPVAQQNAIGDLFASMEVTEPFLSADDGWVGVECPDVRGAVWMMRMMVAANVLSRREGRVLFVPSGAGEERLGRVLGLAKGLGKV
jgi:sirohydrochlorin cobaltochelatase